MGGGWLLAHVLSSCFVFIFFFFLITSGGSGVGCGLASLRRGGLLVVLTS